MRRNQDIALEGLVALDQHTGDVRRALFRQSLAWLANAASEDGPGPLDAIDAAALARSIRTALADGMLDDTGWLARPAAAVALYEIAGALPVGADRRELGRRVLGQLYEGDAATFIALATRMASAGSARALSGVGIRARLALALGMRSDRDLQDGALALALVSRRDLARDWCAGLSTGCLPERRLAARIIERAAKEALRRAEGGDLAAASLFRRALRGETDGDSAVLRLALRSLLADRETLVWRHIATARGLLASVVPEAADEIEAQLGPNLSPTEWRRAATSLASRAAVDPEATAPRIRELLTSPLARRDPGLATALVWGLAPVTEREPEAADELLEAIAEAAPLFVSEALVEIRRFSPSSGDAAATRVRTALWATLRDVRGEPDVLALGQALVQELAGEPARGLGAQLALALDAFAERGTREAHALAERALELASGAVDELEAIDVDEHGWPRNRKDEARAALVVRHLDGEVLEAGTLHHLLLLDRRPSDVGGGVRALDDVDERLATWLTLIESVPQRGSKAPAHATQHLRQLRALLHLIDGETSAFDDDPDRRARVHARWASTARSLARRLAFEGPKELRRGITATVARALDALVRDGAADPADVLLYAALRLDDASDLIVLGEASMHPDVSRLLFAYARFTQRSGDAKTARESLAALDAFIDDLPAGTSQRLESLGAALARIGRALSAICAADVLRALASADASPLLALEDALLRLGQLTASAARRAGDDDGGAPASSTPTYPLPLALGRAIQPGVDARAELEPSIQASIDLGFARLPAALARVIAAILPRVATLPIDLGAHRTSAPPAPIDTALPTWIPARRTLGGFFVQRQLGVGGAGTVFVVTRTEERHDPAAERFALKVPDYDATAARSLSEAEFLKLFRQEAGALLAIPEHENVARFVTFDAGARPKPILVMELVEGERLDQLLASHTLTRDGAIAILDGVLAGLEAIHSIGVGHLDVKPSNVIMRALSDGRHGGPVLVDFGLAGRHIRPGCATGCYGAPEVWGVVPNGVVATPMTADVYSFGCLAYEVLTGATLFDATSEVAMISSHLTHDGDPPKIRALRSRQPALTRFLTNCLRKSPAARATIPTIRGALRGLTTELSTSETWPLRGAP
jgi:hypothetical protein